MPLPRRARSLAALLLAVELFGGCGRKRAQRVDEDGDAQSDAARDAGATRAAGPDLFPELAEMPRVAATRTIALPARIDVPRFEVHGPVVSGEIAVVASSQLGFAGVDWRRGNLMWSKPAGAHVAPPLLLPGGDLALLGDCARPPDTEAAVLGCLRVVTSAGVDRSYGAVTGEAALATAMRGPGEQRAWVIDEGRLAWRRGEATVTVELASGRATSGAPPLAPLVIRHGATALAVTLEDGELSARPLPSGKRAASAEPTWKARGRFAALLGPVSGQSYETPMLRVARVSAVRSVEGVQAGGYFDVLDLDALTAEGSQAAFPAPGIQLLGTASATGAASALAVRLDRSLRRDYVVAYTRTARIAWAHPLPVVMRSDPVGLAITEDAVLAFHDGDTLTVLPPIE